MWRRALVFSCSLVSVVTSCKTNAPSVPTAQVVDGGGAPAVPDVGGMDRTEQVVDGGGAPAVPDVGGGDGADGDGADRADGVDRADGADGSIACRTRVDCGCTRHYTPTRARRTRSADGGTRDETPGDCIIRCQDGRCTATQGPM
jgi:hypothetical protein